MPEQSKTDWIRNALRDHEISLIAYALRITGDLELARDVVQDTFLRLCTAEQDRIDHVAAWLYRVCRNRAYDIMKKEKRMQPLTTAAADAQPSASPGPAALAEGNETEHLLLTAIQRLPENQQEVFRLKFQGQLSYREISEVTGFPVNNVRYLIHTALKNLREHLGPRLHAAQQA